MGIRTRDPASLWTPGMEAFDTCVNVGLFAVEFARYAILQQKDLNYIYVLLHRYMVCSMHIIVQIKMYCV